MNKTTSGFTIVELLITIVVIGILAAITIVAYNGINERAQFTKMRSDIAQLNKAILAYYSSNGSYPITPAGTGYPCSGNWCGWDQATNDDFIPGLVPGVTSSTTPQLATTLANGDTYLYRSPTGVDYKLIRLKSGGLSSSEQSAFADLRTTGCPSTIDTDRWGYWSSSSSRCW